MKEIQYDDVRYLYAKYLLKKEPLRYLSEITEIEFIEILNLIYWQIYNMPADIDEIEILKETDNSIGLTCVDKLDNSRIGLTIEVGRGIEFSVDSQHLMFNQFIVTEYLFRNGFDLFYLIDNGRV